jgi:hypothetical protein
VTAAKPPSDESILASVEPLLKGRSSEVSLGDVLGRIEAHDGPGPVLFVLTLPVLLPLPPGVSMLMALPLLIVAPQIMIGRRDVWMPRWLCARRFKREKFAKMVERFRPTVQRAEARVKPRLRFLTGRFGACVAGAVCTLLAIVLVLPIPFANLAPALALGAFAIGLSRRDGFFVLAGYGLVLLAVAIIALGAHGVSLGIAHLRARL